jgi:hypothetical protein
MNQLTYSAVPTAAKFQKDSSISFAVRSDDRIIKHLDWLLERYADRNGKNESWSLRRVILADLFMTCNFWIKSYHEGNKRMKKERYPAVLALFEAVVNTLTMLLECHRAQLPAMLEEMFGRDLHKHGIQVDFDSKRAKYLSDAERQIYRLRFRAGLAYQYNWWVEGRHSTHLLLADSQRAYTAIRKKGEDNTIVEVFPDWGCFVMTLQRDIYMAKPTVGAVNSQSGMFHSSFTGGDIVTMAGTMLIRHGIIKGIRTDSGHYTPTQMNMAMLLQALSMYGVDVSRIKLYNWDGTELGKAPEFMKSNMTWEAFVRQAANERGHRTSAENERAARGLPAHYPQFRQQEVGAVAAVGDERNYNS